MIEEKLSKIKVKDIKNLVIENATILTLEATLDELLEKIVEDPRSRHVYVVDNNEKLVGSVRLNQVVQYLFPTITLLQTSDTNNLSDFLLFSDASCIKDIMTEPPNFVYEDTTISEMIEIMTKEKINELPILNSNQNIVGEVNILEVITYYNNFIRTNH